MGKIKIGVLVFAAKGSLKVGRCDRKNYFFDSFKYGGLNSILKNLKYDFEYCSSATLDNYDYVLVSLISFHDVLNLVNNISVRRRAKIIVGGPACNNIRGYLNYIDIANFGRCDSDKINRIIDGEKLNSVWRKSDDPNFDGDYFVDNAEIENLLESEKSVGCQQKCSFCFYSWWNGYTGKGDHYTSGPGLREDFFQMLDWERCKGGGITAIDGVTEKTRLKVGKRIKYSDLTETLLRSNSVKYDKKLAVKVYCIVGFPWESAMEIKKLDLLKAVKEVQALLKNKIVIRMHFSHFIPFQKTPLWNMPFNFNNYREYCINNSLLADYGHIQIYSGGSYTSSAAIAAQSTVIQRAFNDDGKYVRALAGKKFQNFNHHQKMRILARDFSKFLKEQSEETIGNIKTKYKYR